VNRLMLAMGAFVALGILAWNTLSDERIRLATLAVLAMFALRTWMHRKDKDRDVQHSEGESGSEQ
jgi:membrane protein implicated in regulation of membrane protease activity